MSLTSSAGGLEARVAAAFDARLARDVAPPLALALSGGGDSVALLHLAASWAARRGRRLLALTVDHGLHPDSPGWTRRAGEAARAAGAEWRALAWSGVKPSRGVAAAARHARHALLAEAAREAGAGVILLAHTADDAAENAWMRTHGSTLGRLRAFSPSPVWPEGRGLMLFRPLLEERRETLRAWLSGRGCESGRDWIEDPANADPRHARARARTALARCAPLQAEPAAPPAAPPAAADRPCADRHGVIRAPRGLGARALAAALTCAGGGARPPRGPRLERLLARLDAGEDFIAVLAGARLDARGDELLILREPGELRRRAACGEDVSAMALPPGRAVVWDGRHEITADAPGWRAAAAYGRLKRLSEADRRRLAALPPAARATVPVLIRDSGSSPVLAAPDVRIRPLVAGRLALALDQRTHETHPDEAADGETPPKALSGMKHP